MSLGAEAPIGVFDSGVGGLSVLQAIRQALPDEQLIYLADSSFAPYGDRASAFVSPRAKILTEYLLAQGVKAIVIACNTASVVASHDLRAWCPVPIIAMEPAIKPAVSLTQTKVIGVLATDQTIRSESVARLAKTHGQNVQILLQACPGLVEQVEMAVPDKEVTEALLMRYIEPLLQAKADVLVLGCTHYPFLRHTIQALTGPSVTLLDPAPAIAKELQRRLANAALLKKHGDGREASSARSLLFTTSSSPQARRRLAQLWDLATSSGQIAAASENVRIESIQL